MDDLNPEIARLFAAKEERRRKRAALSFPEKVRVVVRLQEMAALAKALTWSIPAGLKKTYRSLLGVRDESAEIAKDDEG